MPVLKVPIINIPPMVQIMAWCRSGDKPLSEPMMVSLLTHICVTRPQWVNALRASKPKQIMIDLQWYHTWASRRFIPLAILLFDEQLVDRRRKEKHQTIYITDPLCTGNPRMSDGFFSQRANNKENIYMSRHHVLSWLWRFPAILLAWCCTAESKQRGSRSFS